MVPDRALAVTYKGLIITSKNRFLRAVAVIALAGLLPLSVLRADPDPDPDSAAANAILDRYVNATQAQQASMRGMKMDVDIDAQLPKLKKEGRLHALRSISMVGRVTYRALGFTGDSSVKKDVIARYLSAEVQAQGNGQDLSISPANYKFKYKGLQNKDGRDVYVFNVSPRKKEVGFFKGEIWLDKDTAMPVRESGRFVKNPSIFFKKTEFVRTYQMQDGISIPRHIDSVVHTRIVGPVELSIDFNNIQRGGADDDAANTGSSQPSAVSGQPSTVSVQP